MKLLRTLFPLATALALGSLVAPVGAQAAPPTTPPPAPARVPLDAEGKQKVLSGMAEIISKRAFVPGVDFTKWEEYLAKQKEAIDKAKTDEEFSNAVNGALRSFGFSHIVLMTPRASQARITRQTVGIGVNIMPQPEGILVVRVVPGGPADDAGIVAGDLLVEANGKKITGPVDLQGEEGQKVRVKVKRENGEHKEFTITRRKFSTVRPEELEWRGEETAIIRIPTFDLSYDRQRVEKLMEEAAKAKNLIVDLRSNGGGAVANMMHFLSLVLNPGTEIGTFVNRQHVERYVREKGGAPTDLPQIAEFANQKIRSGRSRLAPFKGNIAVLVNGGSGSASEITAAALRESRNAPVVGTRSAGAVLVSMMAPLQGGWTLQFPLTDYVTAKGLRLEGNGVKPSIEQRDAAFLRPGQKDPAIDYAIALINRTFGEGGSRD